MEISEVPEELQGTSGDFIELQGIPKNLSTSLSKSLGVFQGISWGFSWGS